MAGGILPEAAAPTGAAYAPRMAVPLTSEHPPLRADPDCVIRVGATRVPIDAVIAAFADGLTAEEIVYQYPTLDLAETYAVIAHYLRHREEVDAYLAERTRHAAEIRREAEHRFDPAGIRDRLLSRRQPT